jgi:hypothetical protein
MAKGKVVLSERSHQPQVSLLFFALFVPNPKNVLMEVGSASDVRPGDIFIELDPLGRSAGPRADFPEGSPYVLLRYKHLRDIRRKHATLQEGARR